jgi:hypothetical protein
MDHRFSLSVFTIEVNGTPTVVLQAKRHGTVLRTTSTTC